MKPLKKLGISHYPWEAYAAVWPDKITDRRYVRAQRKTKGEYDNSVTCLCHKSKKLAEADAALIAASPDLYECLRLATLDKCNHCALCEKPYECNESMCYVMKWRNALAKASGEDDDK